VGANYAQSLVQAPVMRLQAVVGQLATAGDPRAEVLREAVTTLANVAQCLGTECKEFQIWEVVLGLDRPGFYWLLTAALILYNIGRGVLTVAVGVLRDEEERSGQSPCYRGAFGYHWLAVLDRIVFVFLFVAAGSLLVHVADWLTRSVFIPV
jgi:hypothetical protein